MINFDQYIGGNFAWFTGVIEDILDPMQMGRVRVRCYGYHTDDKSQIPTESLPWALVMTPVTSASMSGIGQSATGLLQGSWVIGFFRDGRSAQDPIIMGTVPSITTGGDSTKGFSDPSGKHPRKSSSVDLPIESRSDYVNSTAYAAREQLRQEKVETAVPAKLSTVAASDSKSYYKRNTWSNLKTENVVKPIYPNNHSIHSESGHVKEMDDTPGSERLFEMHKTGTYYEINSKGDKTTTIVGDNYTVIIGGDNIYIKGSGNLTVDGDFRHLVKGNYHLEVEGNKTEYIRGSRQSKIGKSEQIEIGQEYAANIGQNALLRVGRDSKILIDGNKDETIGKNNDLLVNGNDDHMVLGSRSEYTLKNVDVTSTGHLFLTGTDVKLESTFDIDIQAGLFLNLFGTSGLDVYSPTAVVVESALVLDVVAGATMNLNALGVLNATVGGLTTLTTANVIANTGTITIGSGAITANSGAVSINSGAFELTSSAAVSIVSGGLASMTGATVSVRGSKPGGLTAARIFG
jgi:hypothetical protein